MWNFEGRKTMQSDQIDQYSEILDKLDEALAELIKADQDFGLTDLQGQSQIQLKNIYDAMISDVLKLEDNYE
jgi:succinate dehydrogenase flavin-adding protein (antitoxin of CptAB toxin-antitoxin module)